MNRDHAEYLQALGFEAIPYGNPPPAPEFANSRTEPAGRKNVRVLFLVADSPRDELLGGGPAGDLLNKMIQAMGLKSPELHIVAIDESPAATTLARALENYAPEMIVAMGERAGQGVNVEIPSVLTYAPAALLQNAALKKATWEDLQKVMARLGLKR